MCVCVCVGGGGGISLRNIVVGGRGLYLAVNVFMNLTAISVLHFDSKLHMHCSLGLCNIP